MTEKPTKIVPNILASISSPPKTGKTHFALSFPEPIKIYSFDLRAKPIAKKFPGKNIVIHEFDVPIIESETPDPWASTIWEEFYGEFKEDVSSGKYTTLVIDPATTLEMILRQYVLELKQTEAEGRGKAKYKLATNEYVLRNLLMTSLFEQARKGGVNLVSIQYLREKWRKNEKTGQAEPTGEVIIDGWDKTDGQVDVVLEMSTTLKAGKCIMLTKIVANGFDRDQNGKTYEDMTYDDLFALLIGE